MSLSKGKKIVICVIAALLAIAIALVATVLIVKFVKSNPPDAEYIYSYITSTVIIEQTVDEYIDKMGQTEQTEENTVYVECSPIDTSELLLRQTKIPFNYISQNPELPTGCEITSLTMVLKHLGYNISKTDMADIYLEKSGDTMGDFWEVFVGNPRLNGFGCYAKPIEKAANKYFYAHGLKHTAKDISGTEFEDLLKYVENGTPVIIWSTMYGEDENNLREPFKTVEWETDGKKLQWISPEHCMVLIGYDLDRNVAIMADPQRGIVEYDLYTVKSRYLALHSQCVIVEELPFIDGVENDCIYYTTRLVNFSSEIESITLNGETKTEPFFIEGNTDKTYEIVATDKDGNVISLTVYTKPIMSMLEPLTGIYETTVTEDNLLLINDIKAAILELDTSYSSTEEQKSINDAIEYCDNLIKTIDDTKKLLEQISENLDRLPSDGIDRADIIAIDEMAEQLEGMLAGKNLTKEQKIIANSLIEKCHDLTDITPPVDDYFNYTQ